VVKTAVKKAKKTHLEAFGRKLTSLYEAKGYTRADFQRAIDVKSYQSVFNWDNGLSAPSIENLLKIAEILEVPFTEILADVTGATITEGQPAIEIQSKYKAFREFQASDIGKRATNRELAVLAQFDFLSLEPTAETYEKLLPVVQGLVRPSFEIRKDDTVFVKKATKHHP
jgi:transcriptional regulator with XRE-family HTH domain